MIKRPYRGALKRLRPSAVRERILQQQRAMFSRLDDLLAAVSALAADLPLALDQTRALALSIRRELLRNLALEAKILMPALRRADAWGETRAQTLEERHRVRRVELAALLDVLVRADPASLVRDLRQFVVTRKADMTQVQRNDLAPGVLRDDVTGVDVNGG